MRIASMWVGWGAGCMTLGLLGASPAAATVMYFNPGPFTTPVAGNELPSPLVVPGKEFSDLADRNAADPSVADPEQVLAWDGNPGNPGGGAGIRDSNDYSGTRTNEGDTVDRDIDALANSRDFLFDDIWANNANLVFSIGSNTTATTSGSLTTNGGLTVGGSGDISSENSAGATGIWASGPTHIESMTPPTDVDGLEIWGPEPDAITLGDTDRYSHDNDAATGTSVWYFNGTESVPYISHDEIVSAVVGLLGINSAPSPALIDLDALMVDDGDTVGDFDNSDQIIFSIGQIADASDPDGFYATGGVLILFGWVGGNPPTASFLIHGGHTWDHTWALANLADSTTGTPFDVNAIEAVSGDPEFPPVPEPGGLALLALAALALRRRVG
jgi:MYXO-CTERM domain-containing protein